MPLVCWPLDTTGHRPSTHKSGSAHPVTVTVTVSVPVPHTEAINTGPLEAIIHNLGKEIEHKTKDGQELQRRWIGKQTELLALQVGRGNGARGAVNQQVACLCFFCIHLAMMLTAGTDFCSRHSRG